MSNINTLDQKQKWKKKFVPLLFGLPLLLAVCAAGFFSAYAPGRAGAASAGVTITVHQNKPGVALKNGFIGVALDLSAIISPTFGKGNLVQYLKTLDSQGVLHLGGNSADNTFWTSKNEPAPAWSEGTIVPADFKAVAALAKASGWKIILDVNFKHKDPARAADEAVYASKALGSWLLGIAIGNEPNYYEPSEAQFWTDFESYRAALKKSAPAVHVMGPETSHQFANWLQDFATREGAHPDISGLTSHYYPACARSKNTPTIASLLSTAYRADELARGQLIGSLTKTLKVPGIIDEGNTLTCSGLAGVSDTFASALWALDFQLLMAQAGVNVVDFNSGINDCASSPAYTLFCSPTTPGSLVARPDYYGLLMMRSVGTGTFLALDNSDLTSSVRVYAVRNGRRLRLVLDNVGAMTAVVIKLGASYKTGISLALTGPSLPATSGVKLGGQTVSAAGTFAGGHTTSVTVKGSTLTLTIQGGSAILLTLNQ